MTNPSGLEPPADPTQLQTLRHQHAGLVDNQQQPKVLSLRNILDGI